MKFLFIVQGEGRGHLTQAITLENALRHNGHQVVEILVGKSKSRALPDFFNKNIQAPVQQFVSPNFLPTPANKRVCLTSSIIYNIIKTPAYITSMHFINKRIKETGAEVVINFYELLTGLTYFFYRPSVPQICIGHQYLFLHKDFKFPQNLSGNKLILKIFTQLTAIGAKEYLALSFHSMDYDEKHHIRVVPPLLRREVFEQIPTNGNYIHGYMVNSGFSENILEWHQRHPDISLRFFWDRRNEPKIKNIDQTLSFYQLDDKEFLKQMAGCKAYASTAGFESVCEAMYLGKPIMMVPAHIEQECNAFDAANNGAGIADNNFDLSRLLAFTSTYQPNPEFVEWAKSAEYKIVNALETLITKEIKPNMYFIEELLLKSGKHLKKIYNT